MHMADALVSPAVAGTMYAVSTAAAAYSVKEIKLEDLDRKVPAMGVMGFYLPLLLLYSVLAVFSLNG